jgi:Family of unknown function (DUF5367)
MKGQEVFFLLVIGLLIWLLGTIYYANYGRQILETTNRRYWSAFVISPVVSVVLCIVVLRWFGIAPAHWTTAMLLLALPGMIGEAVVLSHMSTFMPKVHAASGGRYGAFLFATYALVLLWAAVVTLRATP